MPQPDDTNIDTYDGYIHAQVIYPEMIRKFWGLCCVALEMKMVNQ